MTGIGGQADGAKEYQPSSSTIYAARLFRASLIDCERRGCNAYRATKSREAAFTPRWRRHVFSFSRPRSGATPEESASATATITPSTESFGGVRHSLSKTLGA